MKYRVIGAHPDRNMFDIEVEATNGLQAFGAAALELKEAGEDGEAEFYVAIEMGAVGAIKVQYDMPGDAVVSLETVLDPEQADVYGLTKKGTLRKRG